MSASLNGPSSSGPSPAAEENRDAPLENSPESPAQGLDKEQAGRLMRLATYASVSVATTLILVKAGAWWMTDSVSLLSSLVDSLLDAGASLLNLLAVRHSLTPADEDHRFGHGKAESLSALGQAAFITGSGVFLAWEAIHRLVSPQEVQHGLIGIVVMVVSILLTLGLVRFQLHVLRRTRSAAIGADSLHYQGDLLMNAGVIVALVLSAELGLFIADPIIGFLIAAYILYNAWGILRSSINELMDRELPEEDRLTIARLALAHREVCAIHDLRTRSSGRDHFIQLHVEMDGQLPLVQAHDIADAVEAEIRAAFPDAEVLVHQDPYDAELYLPERLTREDVGIVLETGG